MKKILLFASALAGLFLASCQKEQLEPVAGNGQVTFTIEAPAAIQTKAIADGLNVDQLIYEVWITGETANQDNLANAVRLYQATTDMVQDGNRMKANITLDLVNDQNFTVLFWAQKKGIGVYNTEWLNAVTYTNLNAKAYAANDNRLDAFYSKAFVSDGATSTPTVTLRRPFAQVNLCTLNNKEAAQTPSDYNIALSQSKMRLDAVPTVFNVATSAATNYVAMEFAYHDVPSGDDQMITVNGKEYYYAGMNYVFAGANIALTYDIATKLNGSVDANVNNTIANVPLKENHRTNIVGNLLTSKVDYEIIVDAAFYEPAEYVYVWDGSEITAPEQVDETTYEISQASELAWLAAAVNGTLPATKAAIAPQDFAGKTFVLTENIDLGGQEWTPISMSTNLAGGETFRGTFDGQGHTIKGLNSNQKDVAGLFGYVYACTIKNVTIEGATLSSNHYAGGIVGWVLNNKGNIQKPFVLENCHVKNSTITSTPEMVDGEWDNGDKVGGLVGYAVFTDNPEAMINNCSVENTTVKAYRDFAGLVGYAEDVTIKNCTLTNLTLEQDLTHDYKAPNTPTTFGEYIGRSEGGNTIDGKFYAASAAELQAAVNAATGEATIILGANITGNVTVIQKPGVKITIDGLEHTYNGSIKVHSNSNHYADAALTIKNVNFETSVASVNIIEALENGAERYSTNITVEDCTFTATGEAVKTSVGVQIKASKNAKVINCTATNMHSLIQAQSCDETVVVTGCRVNGKNGVAFKQVKAATVESTTITALEYGIRFDGNTDNYGIVVKNNNVTANQPFIVRKMTGANNTITLEGTNTLTTEAEYQIVITNGSDDEEYSEPTGTYILTGAGKFNKYPQTPVAKVGNTVYLSIDEAVANWTNGSTLTLIDDVTLSDVVTLKSTEHHILNLGTYTLTAASGKHAIEITCNGRTNASYALTVNADAINPGGITATGKSCIYYKKSDSTKDRPIILINNGVFTGSYSINSISNGNTNCPQIWINGGVFNSYMNLTKNMLKVSGGTFHGSINCTGDSSAYRQISGGRFKSWQFMTADAPNKFWVGTAKETYDVGVYVDDEGYLVVGGPVITEFGDKFAAKATNYSKWSSYLKYSSAATNGLYYTNAAAAIAKHGEANVVLK